MMGSGKFNGVRPVRPGVTSPLVSSMIAASSADTVCEGRLKYDVEGDVEPETGAPIALLKRFTRLENMRRPGVVAVSEDDERRLCAEDLMLRKADSRLRDSL